MNLTPEQKKEFEIAQSIDYLFEAHLQGYDYESLEESAFAKHLNVLKQAVKDGIVDLKELQEQMTERAQFALKLENATKKHVKAVKRRVDNTFRVMTEDLEEMPLLISSPLKNVRNIATKRLKAGI